MPPIAILCIDIDGTLIDADEKVHPKDIQAIESFPNWLQPVFTTGRILHSAKGVLQANGLFPQAKLPWPGIFMNGGAAYLPHEQPCLAFTFATQTRNNLITLAQTFPTTDFTFFTVDAVYLVNASSFGKAISKQHHLEAQAISASQIPEDIVKVMVLEADPKKLALIEKTAAQLDAEMAYSLTFAYEINPPNITKGKTLQKFIPAIAIAPAQLPIFCIGDAPNDLSLFALAEAAFAPETAHPKIKSRATKLIPRQKEGLLRPVFTYIKNVLER